MSTVLQEEKNQSSECWIQLPIPGTKPHFSCYPNSCWGGVPQACATVHMCMWGQLWESVFSFHHMSPEDQTRVDKYGNKYLYELNHLAGPWSPNSYTTVSHHTRSLSILSILLVFWLEVYIGFPFTASRMLRHNRAYGSPSGQITFLLSLPCPSSLLPKLVTLLNLSHDHSMLPESVTTV